MSKLEMLVLVILEIHLPMTLHVSESARRISSSERLDSDKSVSRAIITNTAKSLWMAYDQLDE